MNLPTAILEETAAMFSDARMNIFHGTANLHQIRVNQAWLGRYASFGEYVEQECQISSSYASKLLKSYEHYVLKGNLSQDKLVNVDPEKLYLAIGTGGTPDEQYQRAMVLSRSEIKAELYSEGGHDCQHEQTVTLCTHCHQRV